MMNRTYLRRLRLALLLAFCFIWTPAVSVDQPFPSPLRLGDPFSGQTRSPGASLSAHHRPHVNDPSVEPKIVPRLEGVQPATFKPVVYFQEPTPTPPSGLGSVIGLITDATSGERLAGVMVSVDGQTTITNPLGVYRFDKVTPGWQTVVARAAGYQTARQARQVIANELVWNSMTLQRTGDPTTTPKPTFTPSATAWATVTSTATDPTLTPTATPSTTATPTPTGTPTPSPSATLEPTLTPTATPSTTVTSTSTPTPPSSATTEPTLTPSATDSPTTTHTPPSRPSTTPEPVLTPTATLSVTATVSPVPTVTPTTTDQTGSLIGLITDTQTGERLAGVFVSANGQLVQTGSDGLYLFNRLPAGPQLVTATHPGFETRAQTGVVVPNESRWNSIALKPRQPPTPTQTPVPPPSPTLTSTPPASATPSPTTTPTPASQTGTLVGLITDAGTGERLAGVIVSVAGQRMVTAADGIYRFEAVPAGPQVVTAEKEGYQTGQKTRLVTANEVRWNSIELTRSVIRCPTESGAAFDLIPVVPAGGDPHPDFLHGDLNLAQRGYSLANASLGLQNYAGDSDPNAPQLAGLFEPNRYPGMSSAFRVNHWDWSCGEHGCRGPVITAWPATLIGLPTTPGQTIYIPERGPQIYSGGFKAVVLYAEEKRLTLGYTREDSVAFGYTVHLENVCVDPNLLALYRAQNDGAGFRQSGFLPALRHDQALGTAFDNQIMVAIRDRGAFLDPRSRKDWWQGF